MTGTLDKDLTNAVGRATYYGSFLTCSNPDGKAIINNVIKLANGLFLVSNHAVPTVGAVMVSLSRTSYAGDASCKIMLSQDEITRFPEFDAAIFRAHFGESSKLNKFFARPGHRGTGPGYMLSRRKDTNGIYSIVKILIPYISVEGAVTDILRRTGKTASVRDVANFIGGVPADPTLPGDCGALYVQLIGGNAAPTIVGMHMLKYGHDSAYGPLITSEDLDMMTAKHNGKATLGFVPTDLHDMAEVQSHTTGTSLIFEETHPRSAMCHLGSVLPGTGRPEIDPLSLCMGNITNIFRRKFVTKFYRVDYEDLINQYGFHTSKVLPVDFPTWAPDAQFVRGLSSIDQTSQCSSLLSACASSYYQDIVDSGVLPKSIEPLTMHEAINGVYGEEYIDAVNMKTSAGFGNPGPKTRLAHEVPPAPDSEYPHAWGFCDGIKEDVEYILSCYVRGVRAGPIFDANPKDEPMSEAKRSAGKLRLIFASPIAFTLVVRMYTLRFGQLYQMNREQFEGAPGIAAQGGQWTGLYNYITKFGEDRILAGDYADYDKGVVVGANLQFALSVIWSIMSPLYNDVDRNRLRGVLSDLNNPVLSLFGTALLTSFNPSGNPLTVIINGICNSITVRAGYVLNHPRVELREFLLKIQDLTPHEVSELKVLFNIKTNEVPYDTYYEAARDFKSHVALMTYGDDNIGSVSETCDFFDHSSLMDALHMLGIKYTRADKSADRISFSNIAAETFLKRFFVKPEPDDPCSEFVRAPLEVASLAKMLIFAQKSPSTTKFETEAAAMTTFLYESAQHGRAFYENSQNLIMAIVARVPELKQYVAYHGGRPYLPYEEIIYSMYTY
jgi:hypothetical protein